MSSQGGGPLPLRLTHCYHLDGRPNEEYLNKYEEAGARANRLLGQKSLHHPTTEPEPPSLSQKEAFLEQLPFARQAGGGGDEEEGVSTRGGPQPRREKDEEKPCTPEWEWLLLGLARVQPEEV